MLESYDGVQRTEVFITTKLIYYQEWLKREVNKRLLSEEEVQWRQQQQLATQ
jgi:hypothetical protein